MDSRTALRAPPISAPLSLTVISKAVLAGAGLALWGWTLLHLLGTLTVFAGATTMEGYAAWLRQGRGVPLWGLRALLLGAFGAHVWLALRLWARARRARPLAYAGAAARRPRAGARRLRWGAALLLALIALHVSHFSFGVGLPAFSQAHVHANLLRAFRGSPLMTLSYALFAALFGLHLAHGLRAASVSLGAPLAERAARAGATLVGALMAAGFALIPIAIWLEVV